MSKIRENIPPLEGDLSGPPEGDLKPFVVFTQLRDGGPFIYAGFVDAPDDVMAVTMAVEHYGQDQECVGLMAIDRDRTAGADPSGVPPRDHGLTRPAEYLVFVQQGRGEAHRSVATQTADSLQSAHAAAVDSHPEATSVWVVHPEDTLRTTPDTLIWRDTDQSYRLARGYAKDVREKWEKIRRERDLVEYEKDDLQETF